MPSDLWLLDAQLLEYSRTPYFERRLGAYVERLRLVIAGLLERRDELDERVARTILDQLWRAAKYLGGNVSREIPYEIIEALTLALNDWKSDHVRDNVITTALLQEHKFYFDQVEGAFYNLAESYLGVRFECDLIQIAMPRLYRHHPLLCVPLYHELGHFVDVSFGITNATLLDFPWANHPELGLSVPEQATKDFPEKQLANFHKKHRQEFFADIFAACYAGHAYRDVMAATDPDRAVTPSHPATSDRLACIDRFLAGKQDPIVDMFNQTLVRLSIRQLEIRYSSPDVSTSFGNIRPYRIASVPELHGLLDAGSVLLRRARSRTDEPWSKLGEDQVDRVINDIIEKSIRNWKIVRTWTDGTA